MVRRWVALLVAVVAGLGWALSAPAAAEGGTNIDHVEVDADGTVTVLLALDELPVGATPDPASLAVRLDGVAMSANAQPVEGAEIRRTAVLVLDVSGSMRGPRIQAARQAARAYLTAAPPDLWIGLLTFASGGGDAVEPTQDRELLSQAIGDVSVGGRSAMYDAVIAAVEMSGEEGARSILVLADGEDNASAASRDDAIAAARQARVVVDAVSLADDPAETAVLAQIARGNGGRLVGAEPDALVQAFTDQAEAYSKQWLVTFDRPEGAGTEATIEITVTADGVTYIDSALIALPPVDPGLRAVEPPGTGLGMPVLVAGAAALAVGLTFLLWIALGGVRRGPTVAQQQMAYLAGEMPTGSSGSRSAPVGSGVAEGAGLRSSMVAAAEHVVKGDMETRLLLKLQGAGVRLLPAEWLLLHAGIAISASFIGFLSGGPALGVMLLLVGAGAPWFWLRWRHHKRGAAFHEQLPDALQVIAGGLSAGLSLPQALDSVVVEGAEPMRGELRRSLSETRLGVEVSDALDGIGHRMDSEDFSWVVMAIRIQREVGGNLAELLETVAGTLREREHLRGQVRVLSAEGRISALVLTALPPVMFVYLLLVRPDFVRPLYTTLPGLAMLALAAGILGMGVFVMSRMIRIEV